VCHERACSSAHHDEDGKITGEYDEARRHQKQDIQEEIAGFERAKDLPDADREEHPSGSDDYDWRRSGPDQDE